MKFNHLTLALIAIFTFNQALAQQTAKITPSGIGYLQYLPKGYSSNTSRYPVVISLHGIKEKGTTSKDPALIKASLEKVDNVGLPKYVKAGKQYPFILISPQLKSNMGRWTGAYVMEVVNHVKKTLRVDSQRIYLTGLSLGGFGVWSVVGERPDVFAAVLPVCPGGNALTKAQQIAAERVPAWGYHGGNDKIAPYTITTKMATAVNKYNPNPKAKATIFPGLGHVIWDKVYLQTNAINWMLSFRNTY
jgi:predicted peptidase